MLSSLIEAAAHKAGIWPGSEPAAPPRKPRKTAVKARREAKAKARAAKTSQGASWTTK